MFNIYHSYVSSTITDPLTHQIIPIEGSFDTDTIEEIKQRKRVDPVNEIIVETTGIPTLPSELESEGSTLSAETVSDEDEDEEIIEEDE